VLKEASILAQETGDEYGEAVTLTSLGALQHRVGGADRLRDAERNLRRSASLARGSSGIGEGMALGALGAVLLQKGTKRDLEEAEKVLRRALELLPQDAQRVAEDRLSRVLQRRGGEEKLAEAEEMVKRRLIKGGGDLDTAITLNMLAQILLRRGDTAALRRAREASDHSVRLGRELSNKRHLAMALLASAYIAEKLGEGERALASLEEVVALNRDLGLTQQARRAEGSLREMKARLRQQGRQAK
jgi:tetratricopeptide (TPR) repeat protein